MTNNTTLKDLALGIIDTMAFMARKKRDFVYADYINEFVKDTGFTPQELERAVWAQMDEWRNAEWFENRKGPKQAN